MRAVSREVVLFALLSFFLLSPAPGHAQSTVSSGKAHVIYLSGKVSVQKAGRGGWNAAALKTALASGDHVKTGAGSCAVLALEDRSTLKLNASTHVLLQKIQPTDQGIGTKIQIYVGNVWTDVNKFFYQKSSFEVEAGQTTASVRGTAFDVTCSQDGAVLLREWDGTVRLRSGGEEVDVAVYQEASSSPAGRVETRGFSAQDEGFNDWSSWNNYIDAVLHEQGQGGTDLDRLIDELDAMPELANFAAALGGLIEAMPEMRQKVTGRLAQRLPSGTDGSGPSIEERLTAQWQALDEELRVKLRARLEATEGRLRELRKRLRNLPGGAHTSIPEKITVPGASETPRPAKTPVAGTPAAPGGEVPSGYEPIKGTLLTTESGNFYVPPGEEFTLLGSLEGDLIITKGATVSIQGSLIGNATNYGALTVLGRVSGDVYNHGGALTVLGTVEGTVHRK